MAQRKAVAKKPVANNNKRGPKAKQVVEEKPESEVEASEDESEEESKNGVNFDDGSNSEAEGPAGLVDSEAEEDDDEDDDDEDDEDDDDEVEPGEVSKNKIAAAESDDDSDDEPVEEPIAKKGKKQTENSQKDDKETPKKGGIPKVPVHRIPPETPKEQVVFVTQLPQEYKHVDLVALFTKFGPIAVVNRVKTKAGGNNVQIAFESAAGAEAALAAREKAVTLDGQVLNVSRPHDKQELNVRTVIVGLIGPKTTKEQVSEHFKGCGAIESVNFSNNRTSPCAYVRFQSVESIPKALQLHGSELNSRFITVREESYKSKALKTPECTLTLLNTANHESYKTDTIEKIFKKYGDVVDLDIVCTRTVLGFLTYKSADQAQKALKQLNGKTFGDLEIKLDSYSYSSSARTILVTNLSNAVDEQQLNTLFGGCGEIESIKMLPLKALIKFTTDDAFCKSFLLNERQLQNQPIFIEPNSVLKHKLLQKKTGPKAKNFHGAQSAGGPAKFNKFGNSNNKFGKNNNNNNKFGKRPFNKRPAQENGSGPHSFKKAKNA